MKRLAPIWLWPLIALAALWAIALIGNMFGGAIDRFAARCAVLAIALTWIIVPFTAVAFLLHLGRSFRSGKRFLGLSPVSIVIRLLIASVLTLATLVLWPSLLVNYIFVNVASDVRMAIPEYAMDYMNPEIKEQIPLGETEWRLIPEDVRREMFMMMRADREVDGWGHPYMLVAEYRDDELWLGIYSKGQDGVSASRGNDADDQNSWGQDGFDYYGPKIRRQNMILLAFHAGLTFLFFAPICLMVGRRDSSANDKPQSSAA